MALDGVEEVLHLATVGEHIVGQDGATRPDLGVELAEVAEVVWLPGIDKDAIEEALELGNDLQGITLAQLDHLLQLDVGEVLPGQGGPVLVNLQRNR